MTVSLLGIEWQFLHGGRRWRESVLRSGDWGYVLPV